MPRKRNPENKGLPPRWKKEGHVYYYQVPKGLEHKWDGKKKFRLGRTLSEASAEWSSRLEYTDGKNITSIGLLLDRYGAEVVPTKAASSRAKDLRSIVNLKGTFGEMRLCDLKPRHAYMYMDKRKRKTAGKKGGKVGGATTARQELAVLSHAFTMAIEWGIIDTHPIKGLVKFGAKETRARYIEDSEIKACLDLKPFGTGATEVVQSYIRFKLITGLRQNDILRLRIADMKEDGIHVTISKTGKPIIIAWSDALKTEVDIAKSLRPVDISPFLFCNRHGKSYYDEKTGMATGWRSIWVRFIDRVLAETEVSERFTDSDIRAKAGTDLADVRAAQKLLAHSSDKTTRKHYMRKPEIITPAK